MSGGAPFNTAGMLRMSIILIVVYTGSILSFEYNFGNNTRRAAVLGSEQCLKAAFKQITAALAGKEAACGKEMKFARDTKSCSLLGRMS